MHLVEVPREHRRLAAIMFTDMVGFSARIQRNEALTLELLEEYRQILRPLFERQRGREVNTLGDGFLVEFDSALDAVECAVEAQLALRRRNQGAPPERQVQIRIGVHLGDVVHRDGDVLGDGVNIAARIEPLAEPGGVCISEDVYRQILNKLDVPVIKLGRGELKHIGLPVDVYRVGLPGQRIGALLAARLRFLLRQRRIWLAALALAALGAGGGLLGARPREQGRGERITVAVADLINGTREAELDGLSEMLITSIERSRRLSVMTRARMADVLGQMDQGGGARIDEVVGREICLRAGVQALVVGTLRRFGDLYSIDLKVLDPARDEYVFAIREEARGKESIPGMLDRLAEAIRRALEERGELGSLGRAGAPSARASSG